MLQGKLWDRVGKGGPMMKLALRLTVIAFFLAGTGYAHHDDCHHKGGPDDGHCQKCKRHKGKQGKESKSGKPGPAEGSKSGNR